MTPERIERLWPGARCIVAATGPSLTPDVVEECRRAHAAGGFRVIAVNDAYRLMPWADALYACDSAWWKHHLGTDFSGVKWSTHHKDGNDKLDVAREYGVRIVNGKSAKGFSSDPGMIHYGMNSGFQAVNLAILLGAVTIVLVGFNLQHVDGKKHFFGDHPRRLQRAVKYERFALPFEYASKHMPTGVTILNATPRSALKCFPVVRLVDALAMELAA
jgi:hypothetical protein